MNATEPLRRILIVDASRVVRATLNKHLSSDFDLVEENNGESAWQTLMLDPTIAAVISGVNLPRVNAFDLLSRLRSSSLERRQKIPFVLIVSDIEDHAERTADTERGIAGFITKTMKKPAVVATLSKLLEPAPPPPADTNILPTPGTLLDDTQFHKVLSSLALTETIGLLAFGIDDHETLVVKLGEDVLSMISAQIARLLMSKINPEDWIGQTRDERLTIITRGIDLNGGSRFAARVCKSLLAGKITIRGEKIQLTISAGIASTSNDKVANGEALFALANQRLDQALLCGGNNVLTEDKPNCPFHNHAKLALNLLDKLNAQDILDDPANVGLIGLKLLPLLQRLDQKLALNLPLEDIRNKVHQRIMADRGEA